MNSNQKYVSVFKIDGVPILPPLITANKRSQLAMLKEMAVAIETKMKTENCNSNKIFTKNTDDKYLLQDYFIHHNLDKEIHFKGDNSFSTKEKQALQKSETFMFDIEDNTIFVSPISNPQEFFLSNDDYTSNSDLLHHLGCEFESDTQIGHIESKLCSESTKVRSSLPNINILPPTPLSDDKYNVTNEEEYNNCSHLNESEYKSSSATTSSTSPPFKTGCGNEYYPLIRSNSFTLESPSPVLLRHLVSKQFKQAALQETKNTDLIKKDNKFPKNEIALSARVQKDVLPEKDNDKPKNLKKEQKSIFPLKNAGHKSKKSPYDSKQTKVKIRRNKNPQKRTTSISLTEENINNAAKNSYEMLLEVEKRHNLKIQELLNQQKEEQIRLEEDFKKQQKLLLLQLNQDITSLKLSADKNLRNEEIALGNNSYKNIEPISIDISLLNKTHATQEKDETSRVNSSRCSRKLFSVSPKEDDSLKAQKCRENAAIIINAYTRGYLVRRLFKTERVQTIIQTIRETIIFVLHLYREIGDNETSGHVTLKSLLLQQLNSACYTLHNIFFKLPIKERMELIAQDRAHLQSKTMNKI